VAFSPDGQRILTGSADSTAKVWDADKGQEVLSLKGHTGQVRSVAFSPDGKRILTGSWDHTVKVWDAEKGQEVLSLKGHTGAVNSVVFSPDGKRILTGSEDGTAKVWDAEKEQEVLSLKGHTSWVLSVAFSPDGKRILTGGSDNTAKVWDAQKGQEILSLKGHTHRVTSVGFNPDGKRIFTQDANGKTLAWDAETGKLLADPPDQMPAATREVTSPDGRLRAFVEGNVVRLERLPDLIESRKRQEASDRATLERWARFDPDWHNRQVNAALQSGDDFAATFHVNRLVQGQPWDASLHLDLAHLLARQGRRQEAATYLMQALFLNPRLHLGTSWPGRRWKYAGGQFVRSLGGLWVETNSGGMMRFQEVAQRSDHVEMLDPSRDISVRLYPDRMTLRQPGQNDVRDFRPGRWEDSTSSEPARAPRSMPPAPEDR
jgi:DNA-binding beta-propeller fold protein YncE